MIQGSAELREAYRNEEVARSYVRRRFQEPLGALLHRRQVHWVKLAIDRFQAQRVLEVAPGPARLSADIAPGLGDRGLTLVDASAQMLAEARARLRQAGSGRCHFVQADAFNLPFVGRFDLAYTFRLIRHFGEQDRARLYAELARLVRSGGGLVFDAVNETVSGPLRAAATAQEYEHHDALLRPDAIQAELKRAGFEVVSFHGVQHRFTLLERLQVLVAPRSRVVARAAMECVDRLGGGEPLEWVVICRRV